MRSFYRSKASWMIALALCSGEVLAQAQGTTAVQSGSPESAPLISELVAQRVVIDARGNESLESAAAVKPGDLLQYKATYTNRSRSPLAQFSPTLPIPAGAVLVAASGQPLGALASVDGKTFEVMPLSRKVQQPDGRWVDTLVPLADYRALRWPARTLGVNERFVAGLRVRVIDQAPAAVVTN